MRIKLNHVIFGGRYKTLRWTSFLTVNDLSGCVVTNPGNEIHCIELPATPHQLRVNGWGYMKNLAFMNFIHTGVGENLSPKFMSGGMKLWRQGFESRVTFILKERRISVDNAAPYRERAQLKTVTLESWISRHGHLVMPTIGILWCVNGFHEEEFVSQLSLQRMGNYYAVIQ